MRMFTSATQGDERPLHAAAMRALPRWPPLLLLLMLAQYSVSEAKAKFACAARSTAQTLGGLSLVGQTHIITGGNSGIGFAAPLPLPSLRPKSPGRMQCAVRRRCGGVWGAG
jgi:hypothetical protein